MQSESSTSMALAEHRASVLLNVSLCCLRTLAGWLAIALRLLGTPLVKALSASISQSHRPLQGFRRASRMATILDHSLRSELRCRHIPGSPATQPHKKSAPPSLLLLSPPPSSPREALTQLNLRELPIHLANHAYHHCRTHCRLRACLGSGGEALKSFCSSSCLYSLQSLTCQDNFKFCTGCASSEYCAGYKTDNSGGQSCLTAEE